MAHSIGQNTGKDAFEVQKKCLNICGLEDYRLNDTEELFILQMISRTLSNPKNAEYFSESSTKELHGVEFLKLVSEEMDQVINEALKTD